MGKSGKDIKSTIFCLGWIFYVLLLKDDPYSVQDNSRYKSYYRFSLGMYYRGNKWESISDNAKDLLSSMLQKNIDDRISCNEALLHEFITKPEELPTVNLYGKPQVIGWAELVLDKANIHQQLSLTITISQTNFYLDSLTITARSPALLFLISKFS